MPSDTQENGFLQEYDPAKILQFAFIPPKMIRRIPKEMKPGPITQEQQMAIKRILNMRRYQPFNRCRGKDMKKARALRDAGDPSHMPKEHKVCQECRCTQTAGRGTKGNFYGLGVETGWYGVGFCRRCLITLRMQPGHALANARREVGLMQTYGEVRDDTDFSIRIAQQEVEEAKASVRVRAELQLVQDTLTDFKRQLEKTGRDQKPTEYVQGVALPMCDKTRIRLILNIANTISKLNLDAVKLDASKFVPLDAVLVASAEIQQAVESSLRMMEELTIQKNVKGEVTEAGNRPLFDYVWAKFSTEWVGIWKRVKLAAGRGMK